MKTCTKCNDSKPIKEFQLHGIYRGRVVRRARCKSCVKLRRKSSEQIKNTNLKSQYGITLDQWNQMFINQNGCCAICAIPQMELKRVLSVDHNHKTGKVRGLLCGNCNHALGQTKENIDIIEGLIDYLNEHRPEGKLYAV